MSKPLQGIRVVELGTHIAVPLAARTLADWGAEVIKIEPPNGEPWRPMGKAYGVPARSDHNPLFQTPNMNKQSILINLKSAAGLEAMHKLLAGADIFLTNTRPGALSKLGFSYEALQEKYPRLIYAHFGGYGPEGPDRDRPGFDIAAYWSRTGIPLEWTLAGNIPLKPQGGFGDATCGALLTSGLLAALFGREKTGKGEFLQISLYGAALWFNNCGVVTYQPQYKMNYPRTVADMKNPHSLLYKSKDGDWFLISIPDWDAHYAKLLTMLGLEKYISDERFQGIANFLKNPGPVIDILQKEGYGLIGTRDLEERLVKADFVSQRLFHPSEVLKDEQAWANGYLKEITLEDGEKVALPANPVNFASFREDYALAPQLGADTRAVLKKLGYSDAEVDEMLANGAVK
ncbi:MAG: CoA transferase [Gracilibacteraceae bacterium]|jgi:crotonobetainyl-CoA:carnitine CoA-transferase CaiB-like acyl-CoA transferase|nr:CoA transferase [Gracilibacteraceae bacterium]